MLIVEENVARNPGLPNWALNERLLQVSVSPTTNKMIANGRRNEIFEIQAKQWYRIRVSIVHADAVPYNLEFDDQGMCDIHKVAADGIWRTRVPGPSSSVWELTGASRADFAVRCNVSQALVPVYYRNRERVANIWVRKKMANPHVMTQWKPNRPYSLKDMSNVIVRKANKYAVRLGFDYVNSKSWNQMEPITTIAYNQVHEWTLLQTAKHPFHLHLYHMQIATSGGCGSHEEGEFYDTISAPGNCTVRFRTADIGQRCVLHCHVLFHSDSGSMSWVNVTGANMPVNNVRSFQYTCPDATSLSNQT
jgi:FtsP/CotA-like multicopper oxidase with cupredoxin domain